MDKLLTRQQAAQLLGLAPGTLAVWLCKGKYNLPCVKIGSRAKYRMSDIQRFIESRTIGAATDET